MALEACPSVCFPIRFHPRRTYVKRTKCTTIAKFTTKIPVTQRTDEWWANSYHFSSRPHTSATCKTQTRRFPYEPTWYTGQSIYRLCQQSLPPRLNWILPSSALLRTVRYGGLKRTFRDCLSAPSSRVKFFWTAWTLKMGPICSPKTSVLTTLRNVITQKTEELTYLYLYSSSSSSALGLDRQTSCSTQTHKQNHMEAILLVLDAQSTDQ